MRGLDLRRRRLIGGVARGVGASLAAAEDVVGLALVPCGRAGLRGRRRAVAVGPGRVRRSRRQHRGDDGQRHELRELHALCRADFRAPLLGQPRRALRQRPAALVVVAQEGVEVASRSTPRAPRPVSTPRWPPFEVMKRTSGDEGSRSTTCLDRLARRQHVVRAGHHEHRHAHVRQRRSSRRRRARCARRPGRSRGRTGGRAGRTCARGRRACWPCSRRPPRCGRAARGRRGCAAASAAW